MPSFKVLRTKFQRLILALSRMSDPILPARVLADLDALQSAVRGQASLLLRGLPPAVWAERALPHIYEVEDYVTIYWHPPHVFCDVRPRPSWQSNYRVETFEGNDVATPHLTDDEEAARALIVAALLSVGPLN